MTVQYGDAPPEPSRIEGREVYVLDFSFKRPVLEEMKGAADSLCVLDHHKSAKDDLEGLHYCVFDIEKSGARLTWEILCRPIVERLSDPNPHTPWLVDYTEDRDLWRWELPNSKEVSAAIFSYPRTFEVWGELDSRGPEEVAKEGRAILRYQDQLVVSAVSHAVEVTLDGVNILSVNSTCLVSEIAGALAKGRPFGMVWFATPDRIVYSLRSDPDGVDVSEVAKKHGGGGHKHAAGFWVNRPGLKVGRGWVVGDAEGQEGAFPAL